MSSGNRNNNNTRTVVTVGVLLLLIWWLRKRYKQQKGREEGNVNPEEIPMTNRSADEVLDFAGTDAVSVDEGGVITLPTLD
jgi:hypothetical protein